MNDRANIQIQVWKKNSIKCIISPRLTSHEEKFFTMFFFDNIIKTIPFALIIQIFVGSGLWKMWLILWHSTKE